MKNILVVSAGRRVSLVRAFMQQLAHFAAQARVLAADADIRHSPACQLAQAAFQLPRLDNPSYIGALLDLCLEQEVGMVVPTIDTELQLLADNQQRFRDQGVIVVISSPELVRQCRHKRLTHELFGQLSIPVPRVMDPAAPEFPVFIKPVDGSSSQHIAVAQDPAQLAAIQSGHPRDKEFLYLEVIDRSQYDEFTVDMYYDKRHQLCCVVPRKRLEVRAGEMSKGITQKNDIVPFLRQRMAVLPGAIGCLTLQLFRHRQRAEYLGIEINPRFGGGYPLSYQAGAEFPAWLIREHFLSEPVPWFDAWEDQLLMLRYDEEVLIHGSK